MCVAGELDSPKSMREMAAESGAGDRKNRTIFVEDKYWLVLFLRADSLRDVAEMW